MHNVYVAGLPRDYDAATLKALFSRYGTVLRSNVLHPKDETKRTYGFVHFSNPQCAQVAIRALNGSNNNYNRLTVRLATNRENNEMIHHKNKKNKRYKNKKNKKNKKYQNKNNQPEMDMNRLIKIQKQLHHYFSVDNMNKDDFLRRAMDKNGWIEIDVILNFNRMTAMHVTKDEVIKVANSSQNIEIEAKHQNTIRMSFWQKYIPCYDTITQKYESYLATTAPEIARLQTANEKKDQLIKQLKSKHNKHIQNMQQKYKHLEIKYESYLKNTVPQISAETEKMAQYHLMLIQQLMDEQNRVQSEHSKHMQSIQHKFGKQHKLLQAQAEKKDELIQQLHVENNQLKLENENMQHIQLQYENLEIRYGQLVYVSDQLIKLEDDHKELQMRYNELEIKYEKTKKLDYRLWDATDIANWVIGLDKIKYKKYYNELLQNMIKEGIDGLCLPDLNRNDLHRLCITQFKDKRDIYDNLQQLINNKDMFQNENVKNNHQNEGIVNNTPFI